MPNTKKHAKYFEGTLQLRDTTKELLDFVADEIARAGVTIARANTLKNGIDLYLSSQKFMCSLGKKMQERFGGILKITKRLHTVSKVTSKLLYRVTVLFRMLPFKKGDIVKFRGKEWAILGIDAQVRLKETTTGEKKRVRAEELIS